MSTADETPEQDGETRVVQIYPRLSLDTASHCPLQVSAGDTARMVIHNSVATGPDVILFYFQGQGTMMDYCFVWL